MQRWLPVPERIDAPVLLGVALLLGGQSVYSTFVETVPQALSVFLIAAFVAVGLFRRTTANAPALLAMMLMALLLCVVQLIPMPFGWWSAMPGRAGAAAAANAAGLGTMAHAWTLDPGATAASLAKLLPAAGVLLLGVGGDRRTALSLLGVIAVVAALSWLLGMLQVFAGPGSALYLYPSQYEGLAIGVFSNRNHQADLLVLGLLSAGALCYTLAPQSPRLLRFRFEIAVGLSVITALGVLATGSRAGVAMLVPATLAVLGSAWLDAARSGDSSRKKRRPALILAGALVLLLILGWSSLQFLSERTDVEHDLRASIFPNAWYLAGTVWPWGSGVGTFAMAYQSIETLDSVTDKLINAAHNDYLQLVIETGLAGILLLVALIGWMLLAAWRLLRIPGQVGRFALLGMTLLLLHSLVDYPLHGVGLMAAFAALAAVVAIAIAPATDVAKESAAG